MWIIKSNNELVQNVNFWQADFTHKPCAPCVGEGLLTPKPLLALELWLRGRTDSFFNHSLLHNELEPKKNGNTKWEHNIAHRLNVPADKV